LYYDWPGNVRELENFCERLLIVGETGLNAILDNNSKPSDLPISGMVLDQQTTETPAIQSLELLEKESIRQAIEQENYNMSKTAKLLGISRNTLYLKMKKYGLRIQRG